MSLDLCECGIFPKHVSFKLTRLNLIHQTIPPYQNSSLSDLVWDTDSMFFARQLLRRKTIYLFWLTVGSDMNSAAINFEDALVLKPKNNFPSCPKRNKQ